MSGPPVIIVTAHTRADFLWATLHCLSKCSGIEKYLVLISIDRDAERDVYDVAVAMAPAGKSLIYCQDNHPFRGNSYNTLTAYQRATEMTDGLIILVEDDVFVSKGFLQFHEKAHGLSGKRFAVSACRDQNDRTPQTPGQWDPRSIVYERYRYQSLGVSFRAETVVDVLARISGSNYFEQPVETLARLFPNSTLPRGNAEQDGLFDRVLEEMSHHDGTGMLYPVVPRAFHAGFVGANRSAGKGLTREDGDAEQRGRKLLAMSQAEMLERCDPSYRDVTRCDLDLKEPEHLSVFAI